MNRHPHSALIDVVGVQSLRRRFGLDRHAIANWRRRGIPQLRRVAFKRMADELEVAVPRDFLAEVGL